MANDGIEDTSFSKRTKTHDQNDEEYQGGTNKLCKQPNMTPNHQEVMAVRFIALTNNLLHCEILNQTMVRKESNETI